MFIQNKNVNKNINFFSGKVCYLTILETGEMFYLIYIMDVFLCATQKTGAEPQELAADGI